MAVNGLTHVSAKRGTTAKVKWGQGQTGREDRDFFRGTSASKEGHDGTGRRGRRSIQALITISYLNRTLKRTKQLSSQTGTKLFQYLTLTNCTV